MVRVVDESLVSWLRHRSDGGAVAGVDAAGWPANTWILHPMYERRDLRSDLSLDDVYRLRLIRRDQPDTVVDDVDVDELFAIGPVPENWREPPGQQWTRLRWRDLAQRLNIQLGDSKFPPSGEWFPHTSFPANIVGLNEGSLDEGSLGTLIGHLGALDPLGSETSCLALYAPLSVGELDELVLFQGPLGSIPDLVDPDEGRTGTPGNFWPLDHSWFVYTDWDLCATKVSGPASLIRALQADPDLETFDWPAVKSKRRI